ncbi:MAG TPA: hypothetical protein VGU68_21010, partial [Ktedonobacteraceae bacterium]|nr:hypothetical protein [Ktedonobacteraceae bacterium]
QDDEQITAAWLPMLEKYAPAQRHRSRVQLAQQRVKALQSFRQALATGNLQHILNNYDAAQLDAAQSITGDERLLLSLAPAFLRAYREDNDDAIELAERLQKTVQVTRVVFTPQQQQRLAQMRQRRDAQQKLAAAFRSNAVEQIAALAPLLQYIKQLTSSERERVAAAVKFMQAYQSSDDNAFLAAYDALQQDTYPFVLTHEQEQRAARIRRRREVQEQFRAAMASRSPWRLVKAYDPLLDGNGQLSVVERERLAVARLFVDALRSDDDTQIIAAENALQQSSQRAFFLVTDEERQRFALARQKRAALLVLHTALQSKRPREIVAAYNTILDGSKSISQQEREQLDLARLVVNAFDADTDELLIAVHEALQKPPASTFFLLSQEEQQRIALAQQRLQALDTFRQVVRSTPNNAQRIVDAYNAPLLNASSAVTAEERATLAAARRYLAMYEAVHAGIQAANDDLIRSAYEPELARRFSGITPAEQQHIDRAMLTKELEDLLDNRDYGRALLLAHAIQKSTGQPISELLTFKLKRATMRFVREQDLSELSIQIEERVDGNYATVSWRWPATTLIQTALIVWQSDDWPERPSAKSWNDPQWHSIWTRRKNNVLHSSETFPIGKGAHIYVRGYAALLDTWEQEKVWRFSDGSEPTSCAEAESPKVTWRIQ